MVELQKRGVQSHMLLALASDVVLFDPSVILLCHAMEVEVRETFECFVYPHHGDSLARILLVKAQQLVMFSILDHGRHENLIPFHRDFDVLRVIIKL